MKSVRPIWVNIFHLILEILPLELEFSPHKKNNDI